MVHPRGFGHVSSLSMFQLWVQEGAAQSALAEYCPRPDSKSFLHIGDVVVRRQDTSRARVQVVEPLVGDMSVAKVLNPCHLLSSTLGEESVLQTPELSPIS